MSLPRRHEKKRLAQSADILRRALRASEMPELIIPEGWGMLTVTDARLIWISRGRVRAQLDRAAVHSVEITPGAQYGYEVVFKGRGGFALGPEIAVGRLEHADKIRRASAPSATPKVTLAPEDIVDRILSSGP